MEKRWIKLLVYSKIALIGPEDIVTDFINEKKNYPSLLLEAFIYESETETMSIINKLSNDFDLILFAGPIPYIISLENEKMKKIPSTYLPYHGSGVLRALYQVQKLGPANKFSIDVVDLPLLLEAFEELDLDERPTYILEYKINQRSEELVKYHTELFRSGKTMGAVTGLASCYESLIEEGIPVVKIKPFKSVIRATLDKVKLICDNSFNIGNQVSVGLISVNEFDKWAQGKRTKDIQKFDLQLEYSVVNFMKELDGQFMQTSPREFIFFTTRAFIENATKGFATLPSIFRKSDLPNGVKLNLGIGMGGTTNLAANAANIAAKKAQDIGGDSCYIVNENHQLIEIRKDQKVIDMLDLRTTDQQLLQLAEQSTLSTMTLERVFRAIQQVGSEFTANEIAPFIGISVKSTQRVLKHLIHVKALTIVGKENLQTKGRPRRVYRVTQ